MTIQSKRLLFYLFIYFLKSYIKRLVNDGIFTLKSEFCPFLPPKNSIGYVKNTLWKYV